MQPSVYKNYKFGSTQVKYLYQGDTLVWPPHNYDDGDPTTGYDSSLTEFTEIDWSQDDQYLTEGELTFKGGDGEDASLTYKFSGHPVKPTTVNTFHIGIGKFEDGTSGFVIYMKNPGPLDGSVYMYGQVWENSPYNSISPGLMIRTISENSYSTYGITPQSTPLEFGGTAKEEITVPGYFRQVSFKSDNLFLVQSGNESITIPEKTIRPKLNGSPIEKFIIPSNATSIGSHMFYNNRGIKVLEFRESSITTIPGSLCAHCANLNSVVFPSGLQSIGDYAFYDCTSLKQITTGVNPPQYTSSSFENVGSDGVLFIDDTADASAWITWYTGTGLKDKNWTIIQNGQVVESNAYNDNQIVTYETSDGNEVFPNEVDYSYRNIVFHTYDRKKNKGILIYGSTLTALPQGRGEFASTKLVNIDFPSTVTSIGNSMFYNCQEMTVFVMPSQVTSLGNSVFQNCTKLRLVDLSRSGVTDIYGTTFTNCSSLKYVTFPSSLRAVHGSPFTGGHNLEYIRFLGATPPDLTDYNYEPDRPEYSAFYDTWWWKDGVQFFPPIYVPNPITYKNYSNEWAYWYNQGRVVQG